MTSSRTIVLSVLLSTALMITGCGKSGDTPGGAVKLKLVHFYIDQKDLWASTIAEDFERAHPGIDVEIEAIPYGLYTAKIQAAAATGNALGDVVVIDDWFAQELFKRNYTIALDSFFNATFKPEDFFTQFFKVWRKGNQDGQPLLAMPACGGVTALFYNKDLFDKAGLRYPDSTWSYDSLLAAAKSLTRTEAGDAYYGLAIDHGNSTGIDTYIYSNGGKILSDDLSRSAMLEPGTVTAVQSYVDLVRTHRVAAPPDASQSLGQRFMQGRTAMMLTFDVTKQELSRAPFKWDIAVPPRGKAGVMSRQNGQAFGITATSQHPAEAWELIKHIVTLPSKKGINELYSTAMPLYKPLAHSKEFLEGSPRCNRQALLDINNGKVFNLITPGWQEWRDHGFVPNMQDMLAGRKSVQDGLSAIDAKINEVLARSKQ